MPGQPVVFWMDASYEKPPIKRNMTLTEFQVKYPGLATGNLEVDPQFVDPQKGDFHLKPTSSCIDAGGPLTEVAADASGVVVKVVDALPSSDGCSIKGVDGDVIRISHEKAGIVKVGYRTNELTLDKAVHCKVGDAVTLDYLGNAPDIGAFECK